MCELLCAVVIMEDCVWTQLLFQCDQKESCLNQSAWFCAGVTRKDRVWTELHADQEYTLSVTLLRTNKHKAGTLRTACIHSCLGLIHFDFTR